MKRLLGAGAFLMAALAGSTSTKADESRFFWDLKPEELRVLVAAPQVMVTRSASGWSSYCRCPVVLKAHEIPQAMKDAIIAIEDKRYLDHGGVDLIALAGVLRGGIARGGSTIPMQLLKNLVLHDLRGGDTLSKLERKGSEFWHAGTVDGAISKDELLAAYLNQIEFGGRDIVGLYRASRHYFRKEPRELTLYEAAVLAGMVQAPARFDPLKEKTRERAHERAKLVLELMVQQGKITASERARALRVGSRPGMLPPFTIQAQPFAEWVAQTWGPNVVKEGKTVRFFVTLEPRFQRQAEKHLSDLVKEAAIPAGYEAGAVMMSGDGRVQAMIGSVDWSQRQFNNAVKASVQPGSTAKLPLLIAACQAGLRPDSHVIDLPITPTWPANGALGYRGDTTLREAIAFSRNAAAVRLTQQIGVRKVAAVSRTLGLDPGADPDAGFVLGSYATTVMTVTAAYASVANGGYSVEPTGVLAIVDGRGEVRGNFLAAQKTRVIPQGCVSPVRDILREVVRSGTGQRAGLQGWTAYGKTGTTTGNADAWFVGWSEGRVLGTWMGRRRDVAGPGLSGAGAPAEFFQRVERSSNAMAAYRAAQQQRARSTAGPGLRKLEEAEPAERTQPEARRSAEVAARDRLRPKGTQSLPDTHRRNSVPSVARWLEDHLSEVW